MNNQKALDNAIDALNFKLRWPGKTARDIVGSFLQEKERTVDLQSEEIFCKVYASMKLGDEIYHNGGIYDIIEESETILMTEGCLGLFVFTLMNANSRFFHKSIGADSTIFLITTCVIYDNVKFLAESSIKTAFNEYASKCEEIYKRLKNKVDLESKKNDDRNCNYYFTTLPAEIAFKVVKYYGVEHWPVPTETGEVNLKGTELMPPGYSEIFLMPDERTSIYQVVDSYRLMLEYPKFSYALLSRFYPFKEYQLIQRPLMNWWAISINENINWKKINWRLLADKLIHCEEGQEELYDDNCVECSLNKTFPWSEELIEHWERKVNWCYLSQNMIFREYKNLVLKYYSYLKPYSFRNTSAHINTQDIAAIQRGNFPNRISLIRQMPFTEKDLINNMEMLWHDLFCQVVNDEVVDYILPIILQRLPQ